MDDTWGLKGDFVDCEVCGVKLASKSLNKHRESVHKLGRLPRKKDNVHMYECPHCDQKFKRTYVYLIHLNVSHKEEIGGKVEVHVKRFRDADEFNTFKDDLFVQRLTQLSCRNSKKGTVFYHCSRYAHPRVLSSHGQRKEGATGPPRNRTPHKITSGCPAHITAFTHPNGVVEAKFCLEHVGHPAESDITVAKRAPNYEERTNLIEEIRQINNEFYESSLFKNGSLSSLQTLKQTLINAHKTFDEGNPFAIGKKLVITPSKVPPQILINTKNQTRVVTPPPKISPPLRQSPKVIQAIVPEDIARKIVPIPHPLAPPPPPTITLISPPPPAIISPTSPNFAQMFVPTGSRKKTKSNPNPPQLTMPFQIVPQFSFAPTLVVIPSNMPQVMVPLNNNQLTSPQAVLKVQPTEKQLEKSDQESNNEEISPKSGVEVEKGEQKSARSSKRCAKEGELKPEPEIPAKRSQRIANKK